MAKSTPPARGGRLRQFFRPSPRVVKLLWFLAVPLGLALCCLGTMFFVSPPEPTSGGTLNNLQFFVSALGLFVAPVGVLVLILAAFFEKRDPPRAVLWLAAAGLVAAAGVAVSLVMFTDPTLDFQTVGVFLLAGVAPIFLLLSIPGVYFTGRTLPELRATLQDELTQRARAYILARGEITFTELADLIGITVSEVDNLVDDLLHTGHLVGTMDVQHQMIYTAEALAEKQHLLLELVSTQGRVRLDELGRLLKAPQELVGDWIYQLVQRRQFTGYINWSDGWLYSAIAQKIGFASQCPHCGGKLSPGKLDKIVCLNCGSEMLTLSPKSTGVS